MDDVTFSRFDAADYLKSEDDIAGYLEAVAEENDPGAMVIALGAVARARNTAALAREIGLSREGLYRSLSTNGNPSFSTVAKVANAMGYQVLFRRVAPRDATREKFDPVTAVVTGKVVRGPKPVRAEKTMAASGLSRSKGGKGKGKGKGK